jgi:hypothetical protein
MAEVMTDDRRREIFAALVGAQDRGVPVAQSRSQVAEQFGVTRDQVTEIEREGMDNEWPPLG